MRYPICAVIAILAVAAAGTSAADSTQLLENAYVLHSKLFEDESEQYELALEREKLALDELVTATDGLDSALADQSIPMAELRRLEAELAEIRAVAFARSRETSAARQRLYTRLDGLFELGAQIERERTRDLVFTHRIDGMWRLEVTPTENFGLVTFKTEGTIITGIYHMSTGARGTFKGNRVNNRLKMERFDAKGGNDARLEGLFDPKIGVINGSWTAIKLGRGGPESGAWSARKLAPGENPDEVPGHE